MITRENARASSKFIHQLTESAEIIVELLNESGKTREEADHAAAVIQKAFESWKVNKGILKEKESQIVQNIIKETGISETQVESAAVAIQNAFREFKIRHEREKQLLHGVIDWRVAAQSAIRLYRKTGVPIEEARRAATLIKTAYKGYYTRRAIQKINNINTIVADEEEKQEAKTQDDVSSFVSSASTDKRFAKAVRIDYNSITPRVDFGDEEVIEHDFLFSTKIEDQVENIEADVEIKSKTSTEIFIRDLLDQWIGNTEIEQHAEPKNEKAIDSVSNKEPSDQETVMQEHTDVAQFESVGKELIDNQTDTKQKSIQEENTIEELTESPAEIAE